MTNIVVEGLCGIRAEVVLDSISPSGDRLTTLLVDMPRIVHAEYLKHRVFSNSAASSRAIPFAKMQKQLTGKPVRFGEANSGMQDKGIGHDAPVFVHREMKSAFVSWLVNNIPEEEHNTKWCEDSNGYFTSAENWWKFAGWLASGCAQMFEEAKYHKQVYNRLTEAHQMIRVLTTATEWDNFSWLRADGAADPTIEEAARVMLEAKALSKPQLLQPGEWHLPFVLTTREDNEYMRQEFWADNEDGACLTLDEAIKVSCARCAATSFRNTDYDLEKSLQVYDRLVNGDKVHAGALEHCGTPMQPCANTLAVGSNISSIAQTWEPGISHMDRNGQLWSGNFKGYIQFRKLVPNENYTNNS